MVSNDWDKGREGAEPGKGGYSHRDVVIICAFIDLLQMTSWS